MKKIKETEKGFYGCYWPAEGDQITKLFAAGRKYPRECKETREDIDRRVSAVIREWKARRSIWEKA